MKNLKYFSIVSLMFLLSGCVVSPELKAIGTHMISSTFFIVPFVLGLILLIFLMNKFIVHKNGQTDERTCSIIGVCFFPAIFSLAIGYKFGFNWIPISIAGVFGGVLGWFSYTLDELLGSFWENRRVTIPATLGLLCGGWLVTLMFTHVWLEGDMHVTHTATAKRAVVERYIYHSCSDGDGGSSPCPSWDYYTHAQRIDFGTIPPELVEGRDYTLGAGYLGKKDRVRLEQYRFIGGHFFSERKGEWNDFEWLRLADPQLDFATNKIQRVRSNFYGYPMENGGVMNHYSSTPSEQYFPELPKDLPPATTTMKALSSTYNFFKILITEDEYSALLYILLSINGVLILLGVFVPSLRYSIIIFFVCASIIVFILMLIAAARTGSLPGSNRDRIGSGGRFGGGGARGRW